MSKKADKSTENDIISELALMRMSIKVLRDRMNDSLDAIDDRLTNMLPAGDSRRSLKYKQYTPEQWRNFLEF